MLGRLELRHPILQAPMAGGLTPPALVAAVSNAGALGSLAAAGLEPPSIAAQVDAIRALTSRPFGVNLFVLADPRADDAQVDEAMARLAPWFARVGLEPARPARWAPVFEEQFEALLQARPAVASFTFGILSRRQVARLHQAGCFVVGTATTVEEALAWRSVGVDAVCAQGLEAGGHRGTFLHAFDEALVGTMALVPQVVDAVDVPVIAAGGLMDGRGIAAALALGAQAAQLGTAFLGCPEAGVAPAYRHALSRGAETATRLTRAFSGRPARGIVNDFMRAMDPVADALPPYPVLNALTAPMRARAAAAGDAALMSLWAGQGLRLFRERKAADLVAELARELDAALRGAAGRTPLRR